MHFSQLITPKETCQEPEFAHIASITAQSVLSGKTGITFDDDMLQVTL